MRTNEIRLENASAAAGLGREKSRRAEKNRRRELSDRRALLLGIPITIELLLFGGMLFGVDLLRADPLSVLIVLLVGYLGVVAAISEW